MKAIDDFLTSYAREYDFYFEASKRCAAMCETGLEQNGLRAIVTYRAKRVDRLRSKLLKRNEPKKYASKNEVVNDIVDLAGVRIALYFPADREAVRKFITATFDIVATKEFPEEEKPSYKKRFSGYWATHYRVRLKETTLGDKDSRYAQALVEIQVASVLMHAWAEVEHDLVYKPMTGELSETEYAILDQLNGLVLTGEIGLEQLQTAIKRRVEGDGKRFENHYELAACLYDMLKGKYPDKKDEPIVGRTDVLLRFLRLAKLDTPQAIAQYGERFHADTEKRPLVDQLIDIVMAGNEALYQVYRKAHEEIAESRHLESVVRPKPSAGYDQALGFFMSRWIAFEYLLTQLAERRPSKTEKHLRVYNIFQMDLAGLVPEVSKAELYSLRRLRNEVVHGIEQPSAQALRQAGDRIEQIIADVMKEIPHTERKSIKAKVDALLKGAA